MDKKLEVTKGGIGEYPREEAPRYSLNWDVVKRIAQLTQLQFRPPHSPYGSVFIACILLILVSGGNEVTVYFTGLIPSQFYSVLVGKDTAKFGPLLGKSLGIVVASGVGKALTMYFSGMYQVRTRLVLSHYIQSRYVQPNAMYPIVSRELADNPDQRITQDVDKFARTSSELLRDLLVAPVLVVLYTVQTWNVTGYFGPVLIYAFFIVGAVISRFLMTPVISLVYAQERQEGVFRFQHVFNRTHAEAIGLQRGENYEHLRLNQSLLTIVQWQRLIVQRTFWLNLATLTFGYLGSILSYLVIGIPILSGWYDDRDAAGLSELISKASFLSMYLVYQFTVIVQKATSFSDFAGYVVRITQLIDILNDESLRPAKPTTTDDTGSESDSELQGLTGESPRAPKLEDERTAALEVNSLSYTLPTGRLLFQNLTFRLEPGQNLFITGPNGSGKSSLVRILSGLWQPSSGVVNVPRSSMPHPSIMYFPQSPFLTLGSLYDQVVYPNPAISATNNFEHSFSLLDRVLRWVWQRFRLAEAGPNGSSSHTAGNHQSTSTSPYLKDLNDDSLNDESDSMSPKPTRRSSGPDTTHAATTTKPRAGERGAGFYQSASDAAHRVLSDDDLIELLDLVGLDRLARTMPLHQTYDSSYWTQCLSPGEQQKLVFARLLFFQPRFAVLDEGTSSIDAASVTKLYTLGQSRGITFITISHQEILKAFHQLGLTLDGQGSYTLESF
ncbi:ABC transporter transmembrane region 2-domain-containing protein [Dimargaris cristalligena]|uniref:ABC transporter transmembrane region 2-domain-containing protein n=1 Tax=Dimargaris cristalligena TaxID=215637 RepID=A0A4V1J4W3_9FUNG|nr:ABC transporter transmembrane region 2-domain-containing protein [Dimargaris cristalligena]|eukprot:RKP36959.1 ABC transporter transmembrane region 2-domain-containing protein [Dimargaris cristalligena]